MASLVVSGDTSGAITLSAPSVAGTNTLSLPANTGTIITTASTGGVSQAMLASNVAGNGPAFSAYNSSATSLASGTNTQVLFATEDFDTNNNFASSRFTPTVAGYYQLNSAISIAGGGGATEIIAIIYKNGALFKSGADGGTASFRTVVSSLVYANGTTDYFEIYCYSGAARTTEASSSATWFNGTLVRAA